MGPQLVFIVEDEPIVARPLNTLLALDGYQASVIWGELAELLQEIKDGQPDIVVAPHLIVVIGPPPHSRFLVDALAV